MIEKIVVGQFCGAYGIKGWLKLQPFTEPVANITNYLPWFISKADIWHELEIETIKPYGQKFLIKLVDCADRTQAEKYANAEVWVAKSQLPELTQGGYYWEDLKNLTVINSSKKCLGRVKRLIATGANDVLVVGKAGTNKELWIPYISQVILSVDLTLGTILVDWDDD